MILYILNTEYSSSKQIYECTIDQEL